MDPIQSFTNFFRRRSKYKYRNENLFFCTVQKSGSTWIDRMFRDDRIFRKTHLKVDQYRDIPERIQLSPVPLPKRNTILTRLYIDHSTYEKMRKPSSYKTIYIVRDPRDIVVSWYYSCKHSHPSNRIVDATRKKLLGMELDEGLLYAIDKLDQYGVFEAMNSWLGVDRTDSLVKVIRYEDLVQNDIATFGSLFSHCDIFFPHDELEELIKDYRFNTMSGRERGNENKMSHFRKGIQGDWKNHFKDPHNALIFKVASTVLSGYGYL